MIRSYEPTMFLDAHAELEALCRLDLDHPRTTRKEPDTMLYTHGHTTPGCGSFGAVRTRDGVPWSINGTGAEEPTDWRYPLTSSAASVPCLECQRILRDVASRAVRHPARRY